MLMTAAHLITYFDLAN